LVGLRHGARIVVPAISMVIAPELLVAAVNPRNRVILVLAKYRGE
jgi:hypothetical protein